MGFLEDLNFLAQSRGAGLLILEGLGGDSFDAHDAGFSWGFAGIY
jgi:hypothetical protein